MIETLLREAFAIITDPDIGEEAKNRLTYELDRRLSSIVVGGLRLSFQPSTRSAGSLNVECDLVDDADHVIRGLGQVTVPIGGSVTVTCLPDALNIGTRGALKMR